MTRSFAFRTEEGRKMRRGNASCQGLRGTLLACGGRGTGRGLLEKALRCLLAPSFGSFG